jgi:hypothetical protein
MNGSGHTSATAIKNRIGHIISTATLLANSTLDVPSRAGSSWMDVGANPHVPSRLGSTRPDHGPLDPTVPRVGCGPKFSLEPRKT